MGRQQGEFTVTEIGDAPLALHECCGIGSDEYLAPHQCRVLPGCL